MCEFIKTCLACCALIALKMHQLSRCITDTIRCLDNAGCCLPCNAVMAIKDCYDHCNSKVGAENDINDVEMAGAAPSDITMQ